MTRKILDLTVYAAIITFITPEIKTFSKSGDIFLKQCNYTIGGKLFPLDKHPLSWNRCNDAYLYTWLNDIHQDLAALTVLDHLKLAYSTGFCPHNRCQLGNSTDIDTTYPSHSQSSNDNYHRVQQQCPQGLCYTKLEYGLLSFGACCFTQGRFLSGNLIGYYNKSQMTPKPIYAHSRVILSQNSDNDSSIRSSSINDTITTTRTRNILSYTSYNSFINANFIYPGIIATQCPLTIRQHIDSKSLSRNDSTNDNASCTANFTTSVNDDIDNDNNNNNNIAQTLRHPLRQQQVDTTQDVLQMILENKVTLWIQLSPDYYHQTSSSPLSVTTTASPTSSLPSSSSCSSQYRSNNKLSFQQQYVEFVLHQKCSILPLDYCFHISTDNFDNSTTATTVSDNHANFSSDPNDHHRQQHQQLNQRFSIKDLAINNNKSQRKHDPLFSSSSLDELLWDSVMSSGVAASNSENGNNSAVGLLNMTYTVVSSNFNYDSSSSSHTSTNTKSTDSDNHDSKLSSSQQQSINHIWYFNWIDFQLPPISDDSIMRQLVQQTAAAVRRGETVMISCKSGRGRTGTFAAMVIAHLQNATSLAELVDIVVNIREHRDGLVELPSHFRYVARIVMNNNIASSDTQTCSLITCRLLNSFINIRDSVIYYQYNSFVTTFSFGVVACLLMVLIVILLLHLYQICCYVVREYTASTTTNTTTTHESVNVDSSRRNHRVAASSSSSTRYHRIPHI